MERGAEGVSDRFRAAGKVCLECSDWLRRSEMDARREVTGAWFGETFLG